MANTNTSNKNHNTNFWHKKKNTIDIDMPSKHSPSNDKGNNTAYIEGLDTLRGIAILLVLLYHCTPEDNPNLGLSSLVFKVASIGWAGVDLFFVLSGFLICRMLLSLKEQSLPFSIFFWNRLIRIAPIYYLVLFGALIAAPYFLNQEVPSLKNTYQFWLYISNISNLEYVEFYNLKVSLGHFWSLALEMQFYLLFPILVIFTPREKVWLSLSILWLLTICLRANAVYSGVDGNITYAHSLYRCDGLLVGALIASIIIPKRMPVLWTVLGLSALVYVSYIAWFNLASSIFKDLPSAYFHRTALPAAVSGLSGAALFFILVKHNNKLSERKLGFFQGTLKFFAKYSYGIYIYHYLFNHHIESVSLPILREHLNNTNHIAFSYFLLLTTVSCILAVISYHTIEKYFLSKKIRY